MIIINGEQITDEEASSLIRMLKHDSMQIAGMFHGMERSAKFRTNWPDEYTFVESEWKNFVVACRQMYVERLRDPKTPPEDARKIHLCLVLDAMRAKGRETDTRLQLAPNSQQFIGDKSENSKTMESFGPRPNLRAALKSATATIH